MIYFVQPVSGGPIKIGYSEDVPRRHKQLEGTYRQPLTLLAAIDGEMEDEAAIHARFSHLRLGITEQFRPEADLMEFSGCPVLVSQNPAAVEAMPPRPTPLPSLQRPGRHRPSPGGSSEHAHLPLAILIEHSLREYAENHGYEAPQPRR